mmetsp:Transcript_13189/g.25878  ORF Transcript_13189/g.25878 Transcript_13189/m.25878 type:complete len:219 (+) Transcript_13189:371-1027(+)
MRICVACSKSSPKPGHRSASASGASSSVDSRSAPTGPRCRNAGKSVACNACSFVWAVAQAPKHCSRSSLLMMSATSWHSATTAATRSNRPSTMFMARVIRTPSSSSAVFFRCDTRSTTMSRDSTIPYNCLTNSFGNMSAIFLTSSPCACLASASTCMRAPSLCCVSSSALATVGKLAMSRFLAACSVSLNLAHASSTLRIRSVPIFRRHRRCSRFAIF